jgi:hypothetical protein
MTATWWSPQPPWVHEVEGLTRESVAALPRPKGAAVFEFAGGRMRSHNGLFAEFAATLRFPDYFGRNWPALVDCLDDLLWLDREEQFLLVIYDWPLVLESAPTDLGVLRRILADAGANWSSLGYGDPPGPIAFNTLLVS